MHDVGPKEAPTRIRSIDLNVEWDLGWATLTSITAYTDNKDGPWQQDFDETEILGINQGNHSGPSLDEPFGKGLLLETETLSQELVLASQNNDTLEWLAGVYYLDDRPSWLTGIDIPQFSLPFSQNASTTNVNAYAAFAHFSYALTEKLRVNGGLRYSDETKKITSSNFVSGILTSGPTVRQNGWNALTPKLGLDYFPNEDVMIYLSVTEGFKSGAFNTGGVDSSVEPEYITAYEVGVKSTWLEGRLRMNASAFQYDYKDLQVSTPEEVDGKIVGVLNNAAKADIKGLEIEISVLPVEDLHIDVGLAFLDATYKEFVTFLPDGSVRDASGSTLPQAPKFTANVGIEYTNRMDKLDGDVRLRLDYYHSGKKFFDQYENPFVNQEAYDLLNARVSFTSQDRKWQVSVFGKNLTDELVITRGLYIPVLFGINGYQADLAPPRTYGVEFGYNF